MISIEKAKDIMKYFGFSNTSIEPTLCEYKNQVSIFATYKTKYGHLSRVKQFSEEQELKDFLKIYLWYRKNIKDDKLIVEFDDYEKINPQIKFLYNNNEVSSNINYQIITEDVEELVIDTTSDENNKLLNIILEKIEEAYQEIKNAEATLKKVIQDYQDKQYRYNYLLNSKETIPNIEVAEFDRESLDKRINIVKGDLSKSEFIRYFDETLEILENTMLDARYLDNLYLIDYYNEQIKILDEKITGYENYIANESKEKNKLFKSKKEMSFAEYIKNNPLRTNTVDKNVMVINKQTEVENTLAQWKNNNIDDLKVINGIITKDKLIKTSNNTRREVSKEDLMNHFMSLSINERNQLLVLSSPVKELINIINSIDKTEDRVFLILNEKYLLNKFKDIYVILSNSDNFAPARKYLKMINLDSIEDFVQSIDNFVRNINIKPYLLLKDTVIKFKIGVILKTGYINASIANNYPINNRGDNNYYITKIAQDMPVYYAPYIIQLDAYDNFSINENNDIITFDIDNKIITNKQEIKICNYMLRTKVEGKKVRYKFNLFNEKSYITSNLENGE